MPSEKAADFIKLAEMDLQCLEELRFFDFESANSACFHAQQYAEKMIKAKLLMNGWKLERSHDLVHLMDYFEDDSKSISTARTYCIALSKYEASTRYPKEGSMMECTPSEAESAYEMAIEIPYLIGIYDGDAPKPGKKIKPHKKSPLSFFKLSKK